MTRRLSWAEANDVLREHLKPLMPSPDLGSAEAYRLTRRMERGAFAQGQLILPAGALAGCLGLVVEGEVAVHRQSRVKRSPHAILQPGQVFGLPMLLDGRPCDATYRAQTDCEVWFVHRAHLGGQLPVPGVPLPATTQPQEDVRQRPPARRRWMRRGTAFLLVCLTALLAAFLVGWSPDSRQAASIVPMALGELCSQRGAGICSEAAWDLSAALAPGDANAYLALGSLYADQGDLERALQALEAGRALQPDSAELWNNLGVVYARQGDHERAVAAYRRASDLEPGIAETEYNLGLSLQALGAHEDAAAHFESALAFGAPPAQSAASLAAARMGSGQPAEALAAAREALTLDDTLASAYAVLGAAELASGSPQRALRYLRRAIALDPAHALARAYRGMTLQELGKTGEARAELLWALDAAKDEGERLRIREYVEHIAATASTVSADEAASP